MSKPLSEAELCDEARMRELLQTDDGMARFLNQLFGAGGWTYDGHEDVWVAIDMHHTGPGRGFIVVRRGGDWSRKVLPDAVLS